VFFGPLGGSVRLPQLGYLSDGMARLDHERGKVPGSLSSMIIQLFVSQHISEEGQLKPTNKSNPSFQTLQLHVLAEDDAKPST